jgi:hypothetical protein
MKSSDEKHSSSSVQAGTIASTMLSTRLIPTCGRSLRLKSHQISQARGGLAKEEDAESLDHGRKNRQYEHSLLQRRHRSPRASLETLTNDGFKEVNFLQ